MATIDSLLTACRTKPQALQQKALQQILLWNNWLEPVAEAQPAGQDPGYDDDFQQMREQVNKLSGADTDLVCALAEKLLINTSKDMRVATYYIWARLHRDGEAGLAEGLELLAGLMQRFGTQLHPQRDRSRKAALEWLGSQRVLGSLLLYPEATKEGMARIAGALSLVEQAAESFEEAARPELGGLYAALSSRLEKSGGLDAVVPQNVGAERELSSINDSASALTRITSGRALIDQARVLAKYLHDQPQGWLAGHRLMKSVRQDTLLELPALAGTGCTRIDPPKPDHRALLKRLYLQQSWSELLEQADNLFIRGANHLWLDLQWYIHQALTRSGSPYECWAEIISHDLKGLLTRLPGLDGLAFNDGTPFADEVTRNWISQQVMDDSTGWRDSNISTVGGRAEDDDILLLEAEAIQLADKEGLESVMIWLQRRPGIITSRHRWLIRLLMARVAEQLGRNEIALHLLEELDVKGSSLTLADWEPELLFEVKARRLKLLRMKAGRSESDKARQQPEMEGILAGLVVLDPARAAMLCG